MDLDHHMCEIPVQDFDLHVYLHVHMCSDEGLEACLSLVKGAQIWVNITCSARTVKTDPKTAWSLFKSLDKILL